MAFGQDLLRDLGYSLRQLRAARGFTLTATLTLALGIGVSTALFTVVYGVWIDAFPYRDFRGILFPQAWADNGKFADSQWGVFRQREYRTMSTVPGVAEIAAYTLDGGNVTMLGPFGPEEVRVFKVPGDTFQFLGVAPLLGRPIQPSDIRPGGDAEAVVVLSFNLWQRLFGGDASVVGRTVNLSNVPHVIVGVMPKRFGWGSASWATNDHIWLPLGSAESNARLRAWVRLREGVSQPAAAEQFKALFTELARNRPGSLPEESFYTKFDPFEGGVGQTANAVKQMRSSLRLLLYAVAFLLLIACTNVASLQLARGSTRAREVAIRRSVGASRWRIARQLLTENVILALAAGALGVILAIGLTQLIVWLIPQGFVPSESEIKTNVPVLAFAVAISIFSGLLFGMFPAVHGSSTDLNRALKDGGSGAGSVGGLRTRNALVVVQIAMSVILVTGATLAVRGYLTTTQATPGIRPERLMRMGVTFQSRAVRPQGPQTIPAGGAPAGQEQPARPRMPEPLTAAEVQFLSDLGARLSRLPTIEGVAFQQYRGGRRYDIPGVVRADPKAQSFVMVQGVTGTFAQTLGMPLLAGRDLTETDVVQRGRVAILNETAGRLWTGGKPALGGRLRLVTGDNTSTELTVVGIVTDIQEGDEPVPMVYVPFTFEPSPNPPLLYVRTRHDGPLQAMNVIRKEAFSLNPDALLQRPQNLEVDLAGGRLQPRFNMALFGALAAIALALAAAGVYAVLSYQVANQRREIGIRLALGSSRGRIIGRVFLLGGSLVGLGLVLGIGASLALSRFVTSQVFTVPALDTTSAAVAVATLAMVAAVACYVPARRATRINPVKILRAD